jgi:hypothetical protein
VKLENQHIIIVSNEPWGDVWFSKHHYANELAKLGNTVFFVNPVGKWKLKNLFSFKSEIIEITENLFVVNYFNNVPIRLFPFFFKKITDQINSRKIWKHIPKNTSVLVWQFDIFRFIYAPKIASIKRIYHVADPYFNQKNDAKLASNSDLIICTSKNFTPIYKEKYPSKKIIHIPHGISKDEFQTNPVIIKKLQEKYGEFIILTGTISRLTNISLLLLVAKNTSHQIVIAGILSIVGDEKWNELIKLNNVSFVGAINGKELKNWIAASSICLVTYIFDLSNYNHNSSSSLKILNYLAQQKAIISTLDGELPILKDKAIFTAKNEEEFIDFVQKGINGKLTIEKELIERFLHEQTYPILIHKIGQELELNTIE